MDPNETWDATTRVVTYTSIANDPTGNPVYYDVENATLTWMKGELPEGTGASSTGNKASGTLGFSLSMKAGDVFEITPIYQGQGGNEWDVYVQFQNADGTTTNTKIWSKGDTGFQYTSSTTNVNWQEVAKQRTDSVTTGFLAGPAVAALRAKPQKLTCTQDCSVTIYMVLTVGYTVGRGNNQTVYGYKDDVCSTTNSKIMLLDCPEPTNIATDYNAYLIGCEDCTTTECDNDFNDIVLLLTMANEAEIIYVNQPSTSTISKRYMCEDLTDIADFDFNDVVVDVTQTTTRMFIAPENDRTNLSEVTGLHTDGNTYPIVKQEATVYRLCGTVPTMVQVGDTWFGQVTDPVDQSQTSIDQLASGTTNPSGSVWDKTKDGVVKTTGWNPNVTKTITGWDPAANNIRLLVWVGGDPTVNPFNPYDGLTPSGSASYDTNTYTSQYVWASGFPDRGQVPCIIAVTTDDEPSPEGVDVNTTTWWTKYFN